MAEDRGEPSMEEILSSIKRIIAEDDSATSGRRKKAGASKNTGKASGDDVLELTQSVPASIGEDQLLDEGKAQSLARSFSTLQTLSEPGSSPQNLRSGETSLEGLTRELMRPMLKAWLDEHLPQIVEAMVAREISRITKKD